MSDADDASAPTLTVKGGPFDGHSLALDHSVEQVLGSGATCNLRLDLANVEAEHAHVLWDERGVALTDFSGTSGTFVNGEKVAGERVLEDGDRICLGPPGSNDSAKILVKIPGGLALESAPLVIPVEAEPVVLASAPEAEEAPPAVEVEPEVEAQPEPEVAAKPAPTPPPAPAPAPVAPPKPKPAAPPPEYTSDEPSMVPEGRVREPIQLPAAAKAAPRAKAPPRRLPLPRPVLLGGAAALVGLGAFFGARFLHKTPPVLMSVTPPKAEVGQPVTFQGTGFARDATGNVVRFGSQTGQVASATDTQLTVKVPDLKVTTGSANVQVVVEVGGRKSNALFLKVSATPRIAGLDPDVAVPGDEVVAKGANLAGSPLGVRVAEQPAEVLEAKGATLRFRVPELRMDQGSMVKVVVEVGSEASKPANLLIGRLPLLVEVSPPRGAAGDRVTLRGRGFDPNPRGNQVRFGDQPALVLAASATELTVLAPAGGLDAQVQQRVNVQAKGATSTSERTFTVTRASAGGYTPRFFAAPVPDHPAHEHVFVSSELGPVLLLSDKAGGPSLAERAERVAKALNDLVQAAQTGAAATLEARGAPAPGVAEAGRPSLLVAATPADAAGYQEAWDPSAKPAAATPETLARYWAALLGDELLLFVRHERPHHLLELTPRGKVFAELYADTVRRAGPGAAVPMSLVSPLSPPLARALREVALLLPAPGQARPAAAIEGRWRGTMEEAGTGTREIELRLRLDGGRLTGSLTTRAGGLTMDIPLREASYDKAVLRFVLVLRGSPRRFEGTVEGDSVSGSVYPEAGAKEAVGRFSLKFIG